MGGVFGRVIGPAYDGAQMISGAIDWAQTGNSDSFGAACMGVVLSAGLAIIVGGLAVAAIGPGVIALTFAAAGAVIGSALGSTVFDAFKDGVSSLINDSWRTATTPVRRDPLAIDLDADGIETVGVSTAPVLFDHNADGIRTGTGWVAPDDAWLVLDRDGNGSIDSGRELFGVDTQITVTETVNGVLSTVTRNATSGFEALRTLDANGDGQFDAQDAAFGQVQLWRDLNQDGISQADELSLLADHNIVSIGLTPDSTATTNLGNGNTITGTATVTTGDGGSTQIDSVDLSAGNLNLADNPFYRDFTDTIPLTDAASSLPEMGGAGVLRDLREAMSLGTPQAQALTQAVQALAGADTRDAQRALLDPLLAAWAGTARPVTSTARSLPGRMERVAFIANWFDPTPINDRFGAALAERGLDWRAVLGDHPGAAEVQALGQMLQQAGLIGGWNLAQASIPVATLSLNYWTQSAWDVFAQAQPELAQRIATLEQFNGVQAFSNGAFMTRIVNGGGSGQDAYAVTVPQANVDLFNQAYAALQESVYGSLVMQTRLQPYLDAVELVIDETGIRFDAAGLAALIETKRGGDERNALIDLIELNRYARETLIAVGFDGMTTLRGWVDGMAEGCALRAELAAAYGNVTAASDIVFGNSVGTSISAGHGDDFVFGQGGADILNGEGGADALDGGTGNDTINGGAGNDQLFGGLDDDKIDGGTGDDVIDGGDGNDTITDTTGANSIKGGSGNDSLTGRGTFEGGTGDDAISASDFWSGDNYVFNLGDGKDTIAEYGGSNAIGYGGAGLNDTLSFGAGIDPSSVAVLRNGNDLVFSISETDQVTVKNWFADSGFRYIEQVQFADGTQWTVDTLRGKEILTTGTAGADTLNGWNGKDRMEGGGGNDTLNGDANDDQLFGGAGDDKIDGGAGDDVLEGGDGNDTLTDTTGANSIRGGAGNDSLTGRGTFEGGTGDDLLTASDFWSGDSYVFNLGDGKDTIAEYGGSNAIGYGGAGLNDTLSFGAGIDSSSVAVLRKSNDLIFSISETDQVTVKNWFADSGFRYIEQVQFADGTQWTVDTLRGKEILTTGTAGADTLNGWNGKDRIEGGDGNDTLNGDANNDQLFGGSGDDKIDGAAGDDVVDGGDGNDTITDTTGVNSIRGGSGNDSLTGRGTFEGGTGDDLLTASDFWSGDSYVFNLGDGKDTIAEYGGSNAIGYGGAGLNDTLSFGAGIDPSSVAVLRNGNDLVFSISETDQVTVKNWFADSGFRYIEQVQFADGTQWTVDTLRGKEILTTGTAGADTLNGWNGKDRIEGGDGNDTLNGDANDDQLFGGAGDDKIDGGAGDDVLEGGDGNDTLTDTTGANSIRGGSGNDSLTGRGTFEGGTGDDLLTASDFWSGDSYVFNLGDGKDTIAEYGGSNAIGYGGAGLNDTLSFGAGIDPSSVAVLRNGNDLIFSVSETDQVIVKNWFADSGFRYIEQVQFADGTQWTVETLRSMAIGTLSLGTANADTLVGWDGKDRIDGDDGDDVINGGAGNDQLFGGAGDDKIDGGTGDDVIDGGDGNDTITDTTGANSIKGGSGNDSLTGRGTFEGGTGDDAISASDFWSGDNYVFNLGDGKDTIAEYGGSNAIGYGGAGLNDTLSFGAGIDSSSVAVLRKSNDLIFSISETDQVTVKNWFADSGFRYIEQVQFADGTQWTVDTLRGKEILTTGTAGADTLNGWNGKDRMEGGGGNDILNGDANDDQLFGGAGDDKIDGGAGDDVLEGGDGNDTLTDTTGANSIRGGSGNDSLTGRGTFEGGTGDDLLTASDFWSGDSYVFNLGDGKDTIAEYGGSNAIGYGGAGLNDTLSFGAGIDPSSVAVLRNGNDLIFSISETDQVTVKNWFADSGFRYIEQVQFADGTQWTVDTLRGKGILTTGTAGADTLNGWNGKDRMEGGGGNDILNGDANDDQLFGGAGDDKIDGGAGDDVLEGGDGNDTLTDTTGANSIRGGSGNDSLTGRGTFEGGTGDDLLTASDFWSGDSYVFNLGDGKDTIAEYGGSNAIGYGGAGLNDTLSFGAGIDSSSVAVLRNGNDLVFSISRDRSSHRQELVRRQRLSVHRAGAVRGRHPVDGGHVTAARRS